MKKICKLTVGSGLCSSNMNPHPAPFLKMLCAQASRSLGFHHCLELLAINGVTCRKLNVSATSASAKVRCVRFGFRLLDLLRELSPKKWTKNPLKYDRLKKKGYRK